jgi:hypothetical protein
MKDQIRVGLLKSAGVILHLLLATRLDLCLVPLLPLPGAILWVQAAGSWQSAVLLLGCCFNVGGALFQATGKGSVAASEHQCQKLCGTSEVLAARKCMYDAPARLANRVLTRAVWLAELLAQFQEWGRRQWLMHKSRN